ncbi:Nucleoid occlusion factor SlmA [Agromyces sp. NDB4Y10]|uniref:TetR/AcrR family transcriptional regulator n=1 Tax=Agromyces indicus TaxID=758919 RepID=A0ABU1FNV5_9MICO|nr:MULTISPECIES: TetR/AcrR family transcriptional regulator [Agromyces]KZE95508.1 Nucleoid occlusion factor SlmA [Agromyces sp. NDB4Y10]MDR5693444.1 TetR/AcrR family transcriptional regulator [Agromyces indicus]
MPNIDLILGTDHGRRRSVRTEPTQRRSTQRLDALLDAAAEIVDELGFERLTTQMVAERAGASIGTVYRYFPDRVAVLHALRERSVRRYRERLAEALEQAELADWWNVIDAALAVCAELYRDEPGFTVIHAAPRELSERDGEAEIAHRLALLLEHDFGIRNDAETRFRLGIAVEIGEALIHRAFARDAAGDVRYLDEARRVVRVYLDEHLADRVAATTAA